MDNPIELSGESVGKHQQQQAGDHFRQQALDLATKMTRAPETKNQLLGDSLTEKTHLAEGNHQPTKASRPQEWTVVIDLKLNFDLIGPLGHYGADTKLALLKQLAPETKGKPVTIVVQRITKNPTDKSNVLERYEIKNGEINRYESVPSTGYAADLESFIASATTRDPARKTALVVDSHGSGNLGLGGDAGHASMSEVTRAIKSGLHTGHLEKVDLVDFNACLMAQNGVLPQTNSFAAQLVASPELEGVYQGGLIDGQNLNTWIKDLLKAPRVNGSQLGDLIVDNARRGNNGPATPTLTHLDLEGGYKPFAESLDRFGLALTKAAHNPTNRKELERIISATPGYGEHALYSSEDSQKRDLQSFAQDVRQAVLTHKLQDSDGQLLSTANALLSTEHKLVKSYYGSRESENDPNRRYDKDGGLSVFLPYLQFTNLDDRALNASQMGTFLDITNMSIKKSERPAFLQMIDHDVRAFENGARDYPGAIDAMTALKQRVSELHQRVNGSDLEFNQAIRRVHISAKTLLHCPPFINKFVEKKLDMQDELIDNYNEELNSGGWGQFIRTLRPLKP